MTPSVDIAASWLVIAGTTAGAGGWLGQPLRQEAWRHDGHHCVGFVDCQPEWLAA